MTLRLALAAAAVAVLLAAPARAADLPPNIQVTGEGEAAIAPDMALLTLAVMREAPTAGEALKANSDAMAAVIAAMKALGVADRDLQTSGIQIMPRYDYANRPDGTQEAKLAAYQVTNTLSVRVRDLRLTGEIIDRAVALGVNQGGGIAFTNDDPSAALTEARKRAVADALARARTLAEAAGVSLGRVLQITEQSYAQPPMPYMAKALPADEAAVPIEAGETSYKIQVGVTVELR